MKTFLLILSLVLTINSKAQTTTQKDFETIIENMFNDVFSNQELEKIPQYFTSDVQLLEDGILYDFEGLTKMVTEIKQQFDAEKKKNKPLNRQNQFEFKKSYIQENFGWISYENSATFKLNGIEIAKIKWLESAIFIKENGKWKIQLLTSSIIK